MPDSQHSLSGRPPSVPRRMESDPAVTDGLGLAFPGELGACSAAAKQRSPKSRLQEDGCTPRPSLPARPWPGCRPPLASVRSEDGGDRAGDETRPADHSAKQRAALVLGSQICPGAHGTLAATPGGAMTASGLSGFLGFHRGSRFPREEGSANSGADKTSLHPAPRPSERAGPSITPGNPALCGLRLPGQHGWLWSK